MSSGAAGTGAPRGCDCRHRHTRVHCTHKRLRVTSTRGGFLCHQQVSVAPVCSHTLQRPPAMAAAPASVPPPGSQVLLVWSCVGCGYSPLPVFTRFCHVCYVFGTHMHTATLLSLLGLTARDLPSGSVPVTGCLCTAVSKHKASTWASNLPLPIGWALVPGVLLHQAVRFGPCQWTVPQAHDDTCGHAFTYTSWAYVRSPPPDAVSEGLPLLHISPPG